MEELNALNDPKVEMRKVYIQRKLKRVGGNGGTEVLCQ